MSRVSTYLNFMGKSEEAFTHYREVFGTEFDAEYGDAFVRMQAMADPSQPPLSAEDQNKIMHVSLPILAGHRIMATDMLESMGHSIIVGNNMSINLEPDTRAETDRLFAALSAGAEDCMPLQDMGWGGYFGTCLDRFGIRWMFNCAEPAANAAETSA
jgi:PhnB protein